MFATAALLLLLGYLVGRHWIPSISHDQKEKAEELISILGGSDSRLRSNLTHASDLLAKPLTHESSLTIRSAILKMDAGELGRLWDSRKDLFDFTNESDTEVASTLLKQLSQVDHEAALAKLPDVGAAKYTFLPAIIKGWAVHDLEGALKWVRANPDSLARHASMAAIIDQMGIDDPNQAVDLFIEALQDRTMPAHAWDSMGAFFRRWAKSDPEGAANKALFLRQQGFSPDAMPFTDAFTGVIQAWAYSNPHAAAQWINRLPTKADQKEAYATLTGSWAEFEPEAAADFAIGHEVASTFPGPLKEVMGNWVRQDFAEAAAWVDAISDADRRRRLQKDLLDLSRVYQTADRDQAMLYGAQHLDNPKVIDALNDHLERMVKHGESRNALDWTKHNVADPEQRAAMEKSFIDAVIWWRPSEFPKYAQLLPSAIEQRDEVYQSAAYQWSKRDPEAARVWMDALPQSDVTDRVQLGFARGWLEADRLAASEWIATTIEHRTSNMEYQRVGLTDELASLRAKAAMREHAIEESLAIAQEIEHPYLRDLTYEAILKEWPRNQATAPSIRAKIEEMDFVSDDVKWRVLHRRYGHPN